MVSRFPVLEKNPSKKSLIGITTMADINNTFIFSDSSFPHLIFIAEDFLVNVYFGSRDTPCSLFGKLFFRICNDVRTNTKWSFLICFDDR